MTTNFDVSFELSDLFDQSAVKKDETDSNFSIDYNIELKDFTQPDYRSDLLKYNLVYKRKIIEKPVLYNEVSDSILGFTYATVSAGDYSKVAERGTKNMLLFCLSHCS